MLNYKNIIFDFGNVIADYNEDYILRQFCSNEEDISLLSEAIFPTWGALDEGILDYQETKEHAKTLVSQRLAKTIECFYANWYRHLIPIDNVWDLIDELYTLGIPLYILSNAPTLFAENAGYYGITKKFNGILFSAPLKMAKPDPRFYRYLFDSYRLNPCDCLFIDDRTDNIEAGKALGMDGIVFTGDVQPVRKAIGLI